MFATFKMCTSGRGRLSNCTRMPHVTHMVAECVHACRTWHTWWPNVYTHAARDTHGGRICTRMPHVTHMMAAIASHAPNFRYTYPHSSITSPSSKPTRVPGVGSPTSKQNDAVQQTQIVTPPPPPFLLTFFEIVHPPFFERKKERKKKIQIKYFGHGLKTEQPKNKSWLFRCSIIRPFI